MRARKAVLAFALGLALAGPAVVRAQNGSARTGALKAFDAKIEATKQAMMGDPSIARKSAEEAVSAAVAMTRDPQVAARDAAIAGATAKWLLGEALIGLNDPAKARPVITEALAAVIRHDRGSKLHGDLLRSRATLSEMAGDVQDALKDYLQAYDIFRAVKQARSEAIALQDIGNLYLEAGDFERVRRYYSQALEAYDDDPWLNLSTYNNRGQAYREEGKFAEAEREYKLALAAAKQLESPLLEARILTNLADAQVEAGKTAAALATIDAAAGLVRSGEGLGWRPYVYGVRAKVEAKRGNMAEAGRLFGLTFAAQDLARTEMPFRELHEAAAPVYEKLGQSALALSHMRAFQRLDSEALHLTASTSSQLMAARFDYANQNLRIAKLKQGQLERDITIERERTQFRTNLFIGLGTALMAIFGLLSFGYVSIRRSRNDVRAANSELSASNIALGKALKAKTDFLATTSHEIRTPLNGILGMAQVLLADRRLTGDVRERIQLLSGAGETMKTLVDDILDVAKMESSELVIEARETSLSRLVGAVHGLWKETASGKGLTFDCTLENVPERAIVDEGRLRQVLSNLVANAIKFTREGGVTLAVRHIVCEGVIEFSVRDTGIGIAADQHEAIFEAFTQVNNSTTREFSGTGLGLAISRRLAVAMGGDIAVTSVPGEGSCFTLRLPVEAVGDGLATLDGGSDGKASNLAEAHILMVESNVGSHALLRMLLTPETRAIDIAVSGPDAIERMGAGQFDHVVIEGASVAGEETSPLEGIKAIVAAARAKGVVTTLLAAPSDTLDLREIHAAGADQVILKPVGAAELIAALKQVYEISDLPEMAETVGRDRAA